MLAPDPWVKKHIDLIGRFGTILDLAAGAGRHTSLALALGHSVLAVDRDVSRLARFGRLAKAEVLQADLEQDEWPLSGRQFSGIIVCNYLWRPLFRDVVDSLMPGGVLIWTTFSIGNEKHGRPRNPDFLLRRNELAQAVLPGLEILGFQDRESRGPQPTVRQSICARLPVVDPG